MTLNRYHQEVKDTLNDNTQTSELPENKALLKNSKPVNVPKKRNNAETEDLEELTPRE